MTRLIVVVEGRTEEEFVRSSLGPHLAACDVFASATIVGKLRKRARTGSDGRGGGRYADWKKDLERIVRHDRDTSLRVTTLFDLYGLPDDFPGRSEAASERDTERRCAALEANLASDIGDRRFIPYLQRHEFEALVIAARPSLADLLPDESQRAGVDRLSKEVGAKGPEEINDGPESAPSKRLLLCVPDYRKVDHGPAAIARAGLTAVRAQCPRFDRWLSILEALGRS